MTNQGELLGRGTDAEINGQDLMGNRCAEQPGVPRPATAQT